MAPAGTITRDDIQAKAEEIRLSAEQTARAKAPVGIAVISAVAVVAVGAAYFLGRRRGRKSRTVVEVRRV